MIGLPPKLEGARIHILMSKKPESVQRVFCFRNALLQCGVTMRTVTFMSCICLFAVQTVAEPQLERRVVQFSDPNLERVVRQAVPFENPSTNQICDANDATITNLNAEGESIADATGIETLTGLQTLNLCGNSLVTLNVSSCSNLLSLGCVGNQLANLDVSGCVNLRDLDCKNNSLTVLNISSNTALKYVGVKGNPLTNIVVWWTPPTTNNIPSTLRLHYDGNPTFSNPK
jgi:hypothetical protein